MFVPADSEEALQQEIERVEWLLQMAADAVAGVHDPQRSLAGAVIMADPMISQEELMCVAGAMALQHRMRRHGYAPADGELAHHAWEVHGVSLLLGTRLAEHAVETIQRKQAGEDAG